MREGTENFRRFEKMKTLTPIKAIRKKCLECSGGQYSEIRNCTGTECPLYPYRLGKRPKPVGIGLKDAPFN